MLTNDSEMKLAISKTPVSSTLRDIPNTLRILRL